MKTSIFEIIFTIFTSLVLLGVTYYAINGCFILWNKEPSFMDISNRTGSGTLLIILSNFLYSIFGIYANKLASIVLFVLGFYSFIVFVLSTISNIENFKKR